MATSEQQQETDDRERVAYVRHCLDRCAYGAAANEARAGDVVELGPGQEGAFGSALSWYGLALSPRGRGGLWAVVRFEAAGDDEPTRHEAPVPMAALVAGGRR